MIPKLLTRSNRLLLGAAIVLPLLLVALLGFAAFRTEVEVKRSSKWVTHTLEVQTALQNLTNTLVDAETGQRGFLLTHRDEYLEPYHASVRRVLDEIQTVTSLTADNRSQQERLRELRPLIDERLQMLAQTIAEEKQGNHDAAVAVVNTGRGKYLMDKIRGLLRVMGDEEQRLLWIRNQQLAKDANGRTAVVGALIVGCVLLAAGAVYLLHRLSSVTPLVRMCASTRTVEHEGEWLTFEEYLKRRFGLMTTHGMSPAEVEKWREQAELLSSGR